MPLRGHHFAERCSACDAEADGHCVRCGEIFCADHRPADDDLRCDPCEKEYRERLAALEPALGSYISPLLIGTTLIGAAVAVSLGLPLMAAVTVGIGGLGTALGAYGEASDRKNPAFRSSRTDVRALRASFLAERSRLLGPPK